MIHARQMKPSTTLVCSNNRPFAVDHTGGTGTIKLTKDAEGQHHYVPTRDHGPVQVWPAKRTPGS